MRHHEGRIRVVAAALLKVLVIPAFALQLWFQVEMIGRGSSLLKTDHNAKDGTSSRWWKQGTTRATKNTVHPHAGAKHPNGTTGMIIDPSIDRIRPFNWERDIVNRSVLCPDAGTVGIEGAGGYKVLQKVHKGGRSSLAQFEDLNDYNNKTKGRKSKILCMIYTHDAGHDRVVAIAQTWGSRCDGFIAASNATDHSIGAIDLLQQGPEEYNNMWQKVRSMWTYVYDHYLDEFDYVHFGGDDVYVHVDNLRAYVDGPEVARLKWGYMDKISAKFPQAYQWANNTKNLSRPLIFGAPTISPFGVVPVGGPGYTANRAAIELFGRHGAESFSNDTVQAWEDFLIGMFFRLQGVYVSDTQDKAGGNRYIGGPQTMYDFNGIRSPVRPRLLKKRFGLATLAHLESVSEQAVAFHLKDERERAKKQGYSVVDLMYRLHAVLYDWCTN